MDCKLYDYVFSQSVQLLSIIRYAVVPLYLRVIHSKTYRDYMKPRIVTNAIYNMICVKYINTVKFNC
jgi:hypothetical protein